MCSPPGSSSHRSIYLASSKMISDFILAKKNENKMGGCEHKENLESNVFFYDANVFLCIAQDALQIVSRMGRFPTIFSHLICF